MLRVAFTGDFYAGDGNLKFPDLGTSILRDQPHIEYSCFRKHTSEVASDQAGDANGLIVLAPSVTTELFRDIGHVICR